MDFFETVTTRRAIRRLKSDPIPDDLLRRILDAAICAPSGGNRQGWSFLVIRDTATRVRIGELYREYIGELMTVPYYRNASAAPPDRPAAKIVASAWHLGDHLGDSPVLILACIAIDGKTPTLTTGASIYPAVQNLLLAARALRIGSCLTTVHRFRDQQMESVARHTPPTSKTAALIPLGYPPGKFGRPPRRPLN